MQADNDYSSTLDAAVPNDQDIPTTEDQQEHNVQWLLEQDYSDPTEKLFTVEGDDYTEGELSAYEEEVANRPMFGGDAFADDLSSFIEEEIIITEPGQGADIYALPGSAMAANAAVNFSAESSRMAIDHSRYELHDVEIATGLVEEGLDILGLTAEDNIGEQFVVLKKSGPATFEAKAAIVTATAESAELDDNDDGRLTESPASLTEDVFDYVAANEPPQDEQKFDQYLLQGEHFSQVSTRGQIYPLITMKTLPLPIALAVIPFLP